MGPKSQPATIERGRAGTRRRARADERVALRELIAALDRRVPQLERVGEVPIAHDAAALRLSALKRLRELDRVHPVPASRKAG